VAAQLAKDGATGAEIGILLNDRVELNAMTSDALVEMIERKLKAYGLKKAMPDDKTLDEAYRAFHRSQGLREKFDEMVEDFDRDAEEVEVPADLKEQVLAVLAKHDDFRWDDAVQIVLDEGQLDHVREKREEARKESGDFTERGDADEET
jgi:hypothetical protein